MHSRFYINYVPPGRRRLKGRRRRRRRRSIAEDYSSQLAFECWAAAAAAAQAKVAVQKCVLAKLAVCWKPASSFQCSLEREPFLFDPLFPLFLQLLPVVGAEALPTTSLSPLQGSKSSESSSNARIERPKFFRSAAVAAAVHSNVPLQQQQRWLKRCQRAAQCAQTMCVCSGVLAVGWGAREEKKMRREEGEARQTTTR